MTRISRLGRNVWSEHSVEAAGLLVDAEDYYRAFYDAAQKATRHILLAGWQFDTDVCLLRGDDAKHAELPVTLLAFLDALCERNEDLRIYILAWDFHAVFALEREWMQELRFNWTTSERLRFLFDSNHPERGSHHQKLAVIDGQLVFAGGLDLCDHRWDDRRHADANPERISRGTPHRPFHDAQAYVVSRGVAGDLQALFACRWKAAGGEPLILPQAPPMPLTQLPRGAIPLAADRVALSRTDPLGSPTATKNCHEVRDLYADAIASAKRSIYVETQYFSSKEIGEALAARLLREDDTVLDVVLVLNMRAETLKEEVAVGLAQARVLDDLREAAARTRHRLGIFYSVPAIGDGDRHEPEHATYIHSKLMIVDDRFLTIGSANLTNRSMCLDTELNVTVETEDPRDDLGKSIAIARESLLSEHLGLDIPPCNGAGLVGELLRLAEGRHGRLRIHPPPSSAERLVLGVIDPQQLPFDPATME